jgi:large subunit ribosomal protein L18
MSANKANFVRRRQRVRGGLRRNENTRPRLSVHRSGKNMYAQVIDDTNGVTVAAASTLEKDVKAKIKSGGDTKAASMIGALVAERAIKAGVKQVVFDRGGFIFHGRVRALADAAREGGLEF